MTWGSKRTLEHQQYRFMEINSIPPWGRKHKTQSPLKPIKSRIFIQKITHRRFPKLATLPNQDLEAPKPNIPTSETKKKLFIVWWREPAFPVNFFCMGKCAQKKLQVIESCVWWFNNLCVPASPSKVTSDRFAWDRGCQRYVGFDGNQNGV